MNTITSREIAIIGIRILAIYLVLKLMGSDLAPMVVGAAINGGTPFNAGLIFTMIAVFAIELVLAVLCWILAPKIAGIIMGVAQIPESRTDLQTSLFRAVGVLVFITTFPQLISMLMVLIHQSTPETAGWRDIIAVITPIIKLILSVCLILSARGLTNLLNRLRYGSSKS